MLQRYFVYCVRLNMILLSRNCHRLLASSSFSLGLLIVLNTSSLAICLSVHEHISRTTRPNFTAFVHATRGRGSVGVAIFYVLPLLWMTSRLHVIARSRSTKRRLLKETSGSSMDLPARLIVTLTHQRAAPDRGWSLMFTIALFTMGSIRQGLYDGK